MKFTLSVSLVMLFFFSVKAQESVKCEIEFDYAVDYISESNLFEIDLELIAGKGEFKVQLYDMANNKMVDSFDFDSKNGNNQIAFSSIERGIYLIGISQGDCHQSIGGLKGFNIE